MSTLNEKVDRYLEELRESGETNMFGASPYIMQEFGFTRHEAKEHLLRWMKHKNKR